MDIVNKRPRHRTGTLREGDRDPKRGTETQRSGRGETQERQEGRNGGQGKGKQKFNFRVSETERCREWGIQRPIEMATERGTET